MNIKLIKTMTVKFLYINLVARVQLSDRYVCLCVRAITLEVSDI